jgi:hypothetical protein
VRRAQVAQQHGFVVGQQGVRCAAPAGGWFHSWVEGWWWRGKLKMK